MSGKHQLTLWPPGTAANGSEPPPVATSSSAPALVQVTTDRSSSASAARQDAVDVDPLGVHYTPAALAEWVAEELLRHVPPDGTVLDPACGDGALLAGVRSVRAMAPIAGIDLCPELDEAIVRIGGTFIHRDALSLLGARAPLLSQLPRERLDAIVANPPWVGKRRATLVSPHVDAYELARGQYDFYDLFIELALDLLEDGGAFAFILPDSLFLREHEPTRRMLLSRARLHMVARLGEGVFDGVFRGALVVVGQRGEADSEHKVRCLRLGATHRKEWLSGEISLAEVAKDLVHRVPQSEFSHDAYARIDLDTRSADRPRLQKIEDHASCVRSWTHWGRGVELGGKGVVLVCPRCAHTRPRPRTAVLGEPVRCANKACRFEWVLDETSLRSVVCMDQREIDDSQEEWRPLITGRDVARLRARPSRWMQMGLPGINYHDEHAYEGQRLLVRKTGVGIHAAVTEEPAVTTQVVFHGRLDKSKTGVPDFALDYIAGVISSRVFAAYHISRTGESEWRSHPYVTQEDVKEFPVPLVKAGGQKWEQAKAIAEVARRIRESDTHELQDETALESLVLGLYGLEKVDFDWVRRILERSSSVKAIRELRFDPKITVGPRLAGCTT